MLKVPDLLFGTPGFDSLQRYFFFEDKKYLNLTNTKVIIYSFLVNNNNNDFV